jgi:hypothetical protein
MRGNIAYTKRVVRDMVKYSCAECKEKTNNGRPNDLLQCMMDAATGSEA